MSDRTGKLDALRSRARFGQFVSVGVVGAICDTTVLVVLTEAFGVLPEIATVVGIETAILVMFAINENWTFADQGRAGRRSLLERLFKSHTVRAAGSLTQFVVFVAIFRGVPVSLAVAGIDAWLVVAKGGGIGVGMLVNYVAESLFTWRVASE
jgi:putative flippase GtrA